MKIYRRKAPAKVNLLLEVLGKRDDGFHELRTVFDALEFGDDLSFYPEKDSGFSLELANPQVPEGFPLNGSNLILRAAEAYRSAYPGSLGGTFVLEKRIPMGAGLGGGSSDGAQALLLLEEAERGEGYLDSKRDPKDLRKLAASLGADLPFFLEGGRAFAEGRGDGICPLEEQIPLFYLLIFPRVHCDTAAVFRQYQRGLTRKGGTLGLFPGKYFCQVKSDEEHCHPSRFARRFYFQGVSQPFFQKEASSRSLCHPILASSEIALGFLNWALQFDASADPLTQLFNDLRCAAIREYPELEEILRLLRDLGLPPPHLSGSGSTFFLVFQDRGACEAMASDLASQWENLPQEKKDLISFVTTRSFPRLLREEEDS